MNREGHRLGLPTVLPVGNTLPPVPITCTVCWALVREAHWDKHADWHRAEAERIERMLDRSEAR